MYSMLAQIQGFAYDFDFENWRKCEGQLIDIRSNPALYSLMGTQYGGDGRTNFALPKIPKSPEGITYFICVAGEFPRRM